MKMPTQSFCPECLKDVPFRQETALEETQVFNEKVISEVTHCYCSVCGSEIDVPDIMDRNFHLAYDVYKKKKGLLSSAEIRSLRKKYHLSATGLSRLLGAGEKTITRYENGAIQEKIYDRLLRLLSYPNIFDVFYSLQKEELSPKEQQKVEAALANCLSQNALPQPLDGKLPLTPQGKPDGGPLMLNQARSKNG